MTRTWSFFTDLNQGLLPYVPLLLVLAAAGAVRGLVRRDVRVAGMAVVLLLMVLGTETIGSWSTGSTGLMRYAVWTIPVLAWLAAEGLPVERPLVGRGAALAVGLQGGIVALHGFGATVPLCGFPHAPAQADITCHAAQRPLAAAVLAHWPQLYSPDPEVFAVRTLGLVPPPEYPIAYITPDGTVTKVLADAPSLPRLGDLFAVDPGYLAEVSRDFATRPGFFYLHPPKGAMKSFCAGRPWNADAFRTAIVVTPLRIPQRITSPRFVIDAMITNRSTDTLCNRPTGSAHWVTIRYGVRAPGGDTQLNGPPVPAASILRPGQAVTQPISVAVPAEVGRHIVEILPVLEGVTAGTPARLSVEVLTAGAGAFRARIEPIAGGATPDAA
jgi:hypothetical protein